MADQIIKVIVVADAKQATDELRKTAREVERTGEAAKKGEQGFKDFGSSLDATVTKLKNLLTPANLLGGALGVGLVAGFSRAVRAATDYGDQLTRLQIITGSSVRDLAVLKDAAGKAGVSFEALQRGLFFLATEAQTGGAALIQLGISARDAQGVFKDGVTIFFEAADKISKMSDASQRAAAAKQLLGRTAIELVPLLQKSSAELRAMGLDGERLAKILGEAGVGPLKLLKIAIGEISSAVEENLVILVKDLTPALKAMADTLAALIRLYQKLPDEIRLVITILGALTTALLIAAAAAKAFSIAMTLPFIAGLVNALRLIPTAVGVAILELGKLKALLLGLGIPAGIAITVALAFDVAGLRTKLTEAAASLAESFGSIFSKRVGELLAEAIRAAIAFTLGDPLTEMILGAKPPGTKEKTPAGPSPLTPEELQKQFSLTKLLTQAQIELGQVSGNTARDQIAAVQQRLSLQLKEIDAAKAQGQFLLSDAKRVNELKVTLRAVAQQQIQRILAQEEIDELEHQAALEKLAIERHQTGEAAAVNLARVDKNLAEQRLAILSAYGVASDAEIKKRAEATEASDTALAQKRNQIDQERFEADKARRQAEADFRLTTQEREREFAIGLAHDELRTVRELFEDKLISQEEYTTAAIALEDQVLAARRTHFDATEAHARESAQRQIDIVRNRIKLNLVEEGQGTTQIKKIEADLNARLAELGLERFRAARENAEAIAAIKRETTKQESEFLAKALDLDLLTYLDFLDKLERGAGENAKLLLAIQADRFRTQRQMYERDVQNAIDAELQKTDIVKDQNAKQLAIQAGFLIQVERFRQQAIDNSATVLLDLSRRTGDLNRAFSTGFAHAASSAADAFQLMAISGAQTFKTLQSGLSDFLFDFITGAKTIGDSFVEVGKKILRTFLDMFAQIAVRQVALAMGFNVLAQAGSAVAAGGGGPFGAGVPRGNEGAVLGGTAGLGQLVQLFSGVGGAATSGALAFGLGPLIFGAGAGGTGATIGSAIGTIAALLIGEAVGSTIIALTGIGLGIAGAAGFIGNLVLPGIGLIIGGLIGFLVDLFQGPPTARLYVQLQDAFQTDMQKFLAGMVDSFEAHVSADMPQADADRLERQIVETLNQVLGQLLGSVIAAQARLPSGVVETMNRRLMDLARRSPTRIMWGEQEFSLEDGAEELRRAVESLPNRLIALFSEAIFGGLDIGIMQRDGEALADTFIRLLNSMVGFSQVLGLFGGNVDAIVASMGQGDAALAAFIQRSVAFFEQFRKEEETFEDTLKRIVEAFSGLHALTISLTTRVLELGGGPTGALDALLVSLGDADRALRRMADQLLISIESGAQPDEILKLAKDLTDATVQRYQTELQFVQRLAQALEALKVSTGQWLLALQTQIGVLALQTGAGLGQFRAIGPAAAGFLHGMPTGVQLGFLPGLTEALRQAALTSIQEGAPLSGVLEGRRDLIGFGQSLFRALQGAQDPIKALQGLQQLAAGVTQFLAAEEEATRAFFELLIAQEQALADQRLNALAQERQALRDNEQTIQDQIRAIQEAAEARLAPLQEEQRLLQEELRLLQQQEQAVREWADVLESVRRQLFDLLTTLSNPQNALERLAIAQALSAQAREQFVEAGTPEAARRLQDALEQELRLAQEAFQRPSIAYQEIFDRIRAELESIQTLAESNAGDMESLTREIAQRQARIEDLNAEIAAIEREVAEAVRPLEQTLRETQRANEVRLREIEAQERAIRDTLANRIAVLQVEQNNFIRQLREEAGIWLQTIRDEALKRLEEAVRTGDEHLARLLGDKTLDQFIAEKNAEQAARLTEIRDALLTYLGRQGLEVPLTRQRIDLGASGLQVLAELAAGAGLPQLPHLLAQAASFASLGDVGGLTSRLQETFGVAQGLSAFQTDFGLQVLRDFGAIINLVQASQFQTAINALGSLISTLTQAGFTTRVPIPSFQYGTEYVPRTGLALVHEGERVISAHGTRQQRTGGMTVNLTFAYQGAGGRSEWDRWVDYMRNDARVGETAKIVAEQIKRHRGR